MGDLSNNPWNVWETRPGPVVGQGLKEAYIQQDDRVLPMLTSGWVTIDRDRFRFPYPSFLYSTEGERLYPAEPVTYDQLPWFAVPSKDVGFSRKLDFPSIRQGKLTTEDGIPTSATSTDDVITQTKSRAQEVSSRSKKEYEDEYKRLYGKSAPGAENKSDEKSSPGGAAGAAEGGAAEGGAAEGGAAEGGAAGGGGAEEKSERAAPPSGGGGFNVDSINERLDNIRHELIMLNSRAAIGARREEKVEAPGMREQLDLLNASVDTMKNIMTMLSQSSIHSNAILQSMDEKSGHIREGLYQLGYYFFALAQAIQNQPNEFDAHLDLDPLRNDLQDVLNVLSRIENRAALNPSDENKQMEQINDSLQRLTETFLNSSQTLLVQQNQNWQRMYENARESNNQATREVTQLLTELLQQRNVPQDEKMEGVDRDPLRLVQRWGSEEEKLSLHQSVTESLLDMEFSPLIPIVGQEVASNLRDQAGRELLTLRNLLREAMQSDEAERDENLNLVNRQTLDLFVRVRQFVQNIIHQRQNPSNPNETESKDFQQALYNSSIADRTRLKKRKNSGVPPEAKEGVQEDEDVVMMGMFPTHVPPTLEQLKRETRIQVSPDDISTTSDIFFGTLRNPNASFQNIRDTAVEFIQQAENILYNEDQKVYNENIAELEQKTKTVNEALGELKEAEEKEPQDSRFIAYAKQRVKATMEDLFATFQLHSLFLRNKFPGGIGQTQLDNDATMQVSAAPPQVSAIPQVQVSAAPPQDVSQLNQTVNIQVPAPAPARQLTPVEQAVKDSFIPRQKKSSKKAKKPARETPLTAAVREAFVPPAPAPTASSRSRPTLPALETPPALTQAARDAVRDAMVQSRRPPALETPPPLTEAAREAVREAMAQSRRPPPLEHRRALHEKLEESKRRPEDAKFGRQVKAEAIADAEQKESFRNIVRRATFSGIASGAVLTATFGQQTFSNPLSSTRSFQSFEDTNPTMNGVLGIKPDNSSGSFAKLE